MDTERISKNWMVVAKQREMQLSVNEFYFEEYISSVRNEYLIVAYKDNK